MRTFFIFLILFALAALVSGLLAYPVWALLQGFIDAPIHRVLGRVGMLALGIATILFLKRQGLANKATLGYDLPRPLFIRQMLWGFAAGLVLMAPIMMTLAYLDVRVLADKYAGASLSATLVKLILQGLLTGFAVAFVEETFCRGAMFTAIRRESGLLWAIVLPTLFYAATHFLGGHLRIPAEQVNYLSGLQSALNLFERFATPLEFADSFAALTAFGVLLSLIRWRTGVIAGCIGLHAGGVCVIVVMRNLTTTNAASSYAWLVGSYDGVIGWLMLIWIAIVAAIYWRISRPTPTHAAA